jgi:hypothetical protein
VAAALISGVNFQAHSLMALDLAKVISSVRSLRPRWRSR